MAGGESSRTLERAPAARLDEHRGVRVRTAMLDHAQLGDVVAECGVPGREVVARRPGLAQWRRTPWDRVLRVMLQTRWSAEAWAQVRVEFRKALALGRERGGAVSTRRQLTHGAGLRENSCLTGRRIGRDESCARASRFYSAIGGENDALSLVLSDSDARGFH